MTKWTYCNMTYGQILSHEPPGEIEVVYSILGNYIKTLFVCLSVLGFNVQFKEIFSAI